MFLESSIFTVQDNEKYEVVLEGSEIHELRNEVIKKLKTSKSEKERKKLLTRLKSLNKVKPVREE